MKLKLILKLNSSSLLTLSVCPSPPAFPSILNSLLLRRKDQTSYSRNFLWSCIRKYYQWEQKSKQISFAWGVSLALVLDVAKVLKADIKFFLSPTCVKNKNRRSQFRASGTFSFEENCSFKMLQRGREPEDIAASFLISALNQTKDLFVWSTDKL